MPTNVSPMFSPSSRRRDTGLKDTTTIIQSQVMGGFVMSRAFLSRDWNRRALGMALVAIVIALGLLARPQVGAAQSSREADGARLLKGALDLHFHMDPWTPGALNGQAGIADVRVARSRGMRGLVIKRTDGAAGVPPSPRDAWIRVVRRFCHELAEWRDQSGRR